MHPQAPGSPPPSQVADEGLVHDHDRDGIGPSVPKLMNAVGKGEEDCLWW